MREGEYSFYRLAEVLRQKDGNYTGGSGLDGSSDLKTVPGLIYRQNGKIYINPQIEPMDFNAIPFLYSLLPCEKTRSSTTSHPVDALSGALIACPVSTKG